MVTEILDHLARIVLFLILGLFLFKGMILAHGRKIKDELQAQIEHANSVSGAIMIGAVLICFTMLRVFG